jgi:hypothetical protein
MTWSSVDTARIGAVVGLGYIACSAVDVHQCPEQGLHDAALRPQNIVPSRWKAYHNSSDRLLRGRPYWRLIAPLLKKDENNDLVVYILEMPGDVVWFAPFDVASTRSPSRKVGASAISERSLELAACFKSQVLASAKLTCQQI